jgi:hypothetical protein
MRTTTLLLAAAFACIATAAQAQINSPPPTLQGQPSFHLWSVPGVISSGGLATFFSCTNTTGAPIRVGIEVFGPGGGGAANDPSATSFNVAAGGTVLFGTDVAAGLSVNGPLGAALPEGSARVLATAKSGIICSAFLADKGNAPPTSMTSLTVVKTTKQKGD